MKISKPACLLTSDRGRRRRQPTCPESSPKQQQPKEMTEKIISLLNNHLQTVTRKSKQLVKNFVNDSPPTKSSSSYILIDELSDIVTTELAKMLYPNNPQRNDFNARCKDLLNCLRTRLDSKSNKADFARYLLWFLQFIRASVVWSMVCVGNDSGLLNWDSSADIDDSTTSDRNSNLITSDRNADSITKSKRKSSAQITKPSPFSSAITSSPDQSSNPSYKQQQRRKSFAGASVESFTSSSAAEKTTISSLSSHRRQSTGGSSLFTNPQQHQPKKLFSEKLNFFENKIQQQQQNDSPPKYTHPPSSPNQRSSKAQKQENSLNEALSGAWPVMSDQFLDAVKKHQQTNGFGSFKSSTGVKPDVAVDAVAKSQSEPLGDPDKKPSSIVTSSPVNSSTSVKSPTKRKNWISAAFGSKLSSSKSTSIPHLADKSVEDVSEQQLSNDSTNIDRTHNQTARSMGSLLLGKSSVSSSTSTLALANPSSGGDDAAARARFSQAILEHASKLRSGGQQPKQPKPDTVSIRLKQVLPSAVSGQHSSGINSEAGISRLEFLIELNQPARIGRSNSKNHKNFISLGQRLVVSRNHLDLFTDDSNRVWIRDCGSNSGTWLNGERLSAAGQVSEDFELTSGDLVQLGSDCKLPQNVESQVEQYIASAQFKSNHASSIKPSKTEDTAVFSKSSETPSGVDNAGEQFHTGKSPSQQTTLNKDDDEVVEDDLSKSPIIHSNDDARRKFDFLAMKREEFFQRYKCVLFEVEMVG